MANSHTYTIEEAVKETKVNSKVKFDATVELHINLNLDKNQPIRFSVNPPHGTGKKIKVAVLTSDKIPEADIELSETDLTKIEKGDLKPKVDFDVLVTQPSYMPKVAKVARILGPAGVMPNPKNGTVTEDIQATVEELKKGRIEVRTEKEVPIIHTVIGKVSFKENELIENYQEIYNTLLQNKPQKAKPEWIQSIFICSSMGPSYKISL